MTENYHTHTYRCSHASDTEKEYIERAIQNGIKKMGFSDHAPFAFPDNYESGFRIKVKDAENYISTLQALKEEYKKDIKIFIGFEMEYYPLYFKDMFSYVRSLGAEYLILGQHFIKNEYPNGIYSGVPNNDEEHLKEYVSCVIEGMKTGAFTYVAHPDLFNFTGEKEVYKSEMRKLCRASREIGVPLELNFLGIRDSRHYPNSAFWEIAGEEKCDTVFGFDAHSAKAAFDGDSLKTAEKMVKMYGVHLIKHPVLKILNNENN